MADEIYAKAGEQVTCYAGHPYGSFARDVMRGEPIRSADFVYTDGSRPEHNSLIRPCHCGAKAIRLLGGLAQAHFPGEGWRSLYGDEA